ncbi:hypothetical protein WJX82_011197 [Trebouxia sp. C0006]
MKIKKRSGDKEHCLRLLPCLRRCPRHPHQDEQLVDHLVPFWKMQFIWCQRDQAGPNVVSTSVHWEQDLNAGMVHPPEECQR